MRGDEIEARESRDNKQMSVIIVESELSEHTFLFG